MIANTTAVVVIAVVLCLKDTGAGRFVNNAKERTTMYRAIVKVRKCNAAGTTKTIRHIFKAKITDKPNANEMCVEDRVAAVVSNLPFPVDRKNVRAIANTLDSYSSAHLPDDLRCKHWVISFQSDLDPVSRSRQVELCQSLAFAFNKRWCHSAPFVAAVHTDRKHIHIHGVSSNWIRENGQAMNWKTRDVLAMSSMRWLPANLAVEVESGAFLYSEAGTKVYPRDKACELLAIELQANPGEKLKALVAAKAVTITKTTGGHVALRYLGKKFGRRQVNHELKKLGSLILDKKLNTTSVYERSALEQQQAIDRALGIGKMTLAEFDAVADLPNPLMVCKTQEEVRTLEAFRSSGGVIRDKRMAMILARLARTAMRRRLLGAVVPHTHDKYVNFVYTPDLSLLPIQLCFWLLQVLVDCGDEFKQEKLFKELERITRPAISI